MVRIGFYWVSTEFFFVSKHKTQCYLVRQGFTCLPFFLRFAESYRVLPSFTELPCSLAEWNVVNLAVVVVVVVVVDVVVAVVFD